MTSFKRVLSNAGWSLAGNVAPLVAAAVLMPFIVSRLGLARFGLLSLAWILLGYVSLFDLGVGRAMTKLLAERWRGSSSAEIDSLTATGLMFVAIFGLAGLALMAVSSPLVFKWFSQVPRELTGETRSSYWLIALGIPVVVVTAALRSVLEGVGAFRILNLIRTPAGVLLFAAPAVTALYSPRLDAAIGGLLVARVIVLIAHVPPCVSRVRIRLRSVDAGRWLRPFMSFGGWLTVASIVGPVLVYLDRFVLGVALSLSAVAYYTAPFEIVARLLVVPYALATAMFPALVSLSQNPSAGLALRRRATGVVLSITIPVCVIGFFGAAPGLRAWLGPSFAERSAAVLRVLLGGFALVSLAQIPMAALLGAGQARAVALMYLAELPTYPILLWSLTKTYGIVGAATAWSIRAAVDYIALTAILAVKEARPSPSFDASSKAPWL